MVQKRSLPKARNPLLDPEATPSHEVLVERRRLGQTNLAVKPGQVGTSNATKPENLGMFDYAHLRAPLPKDLSDSDIFGPQSTHQPFPDSYFLMRRSSDGFVSATGMFKASFPYASLAEEEAERKFIKSLPTTSQDEKAGNIWIPPSHALKLAEEYHVRPWIEALLDPAPIEMSGSTKKSISPPPKFILPDNIADALLPPPTTTPGRGRGRRAASPSKIASPAKKAASPRKRTTKAAKEANAATATAASASLQAALDSAASVAESDSVEGEKEGEKAQVQVDSTVDTNGDVETTHTAVKVEMPASSPELPTPESTEEMIARAKEMVEEARKLEGESVAKEKKASKRKAVDLEEDEDSSLETQASKKTKLLEQELKKEKIRTRALLGLSATLAIGAILPYVL
ncbi:MAG: hypothetical protein M1819_001224 [Sarea resinae]|nr:MAG: hypothetical protein M1819_001224 [Sarea resinae]